MKNYLLTLMNNNYKRINSMETKELKVQIPEGYEIDKEKLYI